MDVVVERTVRLPRALASTVMVPAMTGAQQRLAWALVACAYARKRVVDGGRQVFRIERPALFDLAGGRINNLTVELERLQRDAVMWAPGHVAHGRRLFEVLRYEPGHVGQLGWIVADVDGTVKTMLADADQCWISLKQFQATGKQVAVALLVRGAACGWRMESVDRPPLDIHIRQQDLGMWSEKAAKARWAVWVRDSLTPAIRELVASPERLVDFAVMKSERGTTDATIKVDRRIIRDGANEGILSTLAPGRIERWIGPDAARTPSVTSMRQAYAIENERKSKKAELDEEREEIARDKAKVHAARAAAAREMEEARRMMAEAKRMLAGVKAQPAAAAPVRRVVEYKPKLGD